MKEKIRFLIKFKKKNLSLNGVNRLLSFVDWLVLHNSHFEEIQILKGEIILLQKIIEKFCVFSEYVSTKVIN